MSTTSTTTRSYRVLIFNYRGLGSMVSIINSTWRQLLASTPEGEQHMTGFITSGNTTPSISLLSTLAHRCRLHTISSYSIWDHQRHLVIKLMYCTILTYTMLNLVMILCAQNIVPIFIQLNAHNVNIEMV